MKKLVIAMGIVNVVLLVIIGYLVFGRVDPCVRVAELKSEVEEKYRTPLTQGERQSELRTLTGRRSYTSPSVILSGKLPPPINERQVDKEIIARVDAMTVFRPELVPKRLERRRLTAAFQCQRSLSRRITHNKRYV
jgi:hypothetical protein